MFQMKPSSILLLASQVPFSRGGAEILLDRLKDAIASTGHHVDILSLPFSAEPKSRLVEQMLLWRSFSLEHVSGRKIDLVIPTKFPTYFAQHPNKVVWLIHQHRQAYELVGTRYGDFSQNPEDESVRKAILLGDGKALSEAKKIFTISDTVSRRVKDFLDLDSVSLPPPLPFRSSYREGSKGNYILSVGRLCSTKRTDLIINALPGITTDLHLKIVGLPDEPQYEEYLKSEIRKHHISDRVEFCGSVSEEELASLYANCFSVFYSPYDEDYGFVTYEAAKSGKPVLTMQDSGYVREVVESSGCGFVLELDSDAISSAHNELYQDDAKYALLQEQCRKLIIPYDWDEIARKLLEAGGISA